MTDTSYFAGSQYLGSSQLPGTVVSHYCCISCGKEFITEVPEGARQHRWLHSYCLEHQLVAQTHWPWLLYEAAWGNKPLWMWPIDRTLDLPAGVLRLIFLAEMRHLDHLES